MKIYYDNIIYSLQKAGGISAYWSEISKRLVLLNIEINFFGYSNENIFMNNLDFNVKKESSIYFKICRYLDFRKKLPSKSIFHSSYYRISNQKDIVNITTVHDFTYEYFKNGLSKLVHTYQKSRAIKRSDGIICVSKNTKKDLLRFYPHLKEENVAVIYHGVCHLFYKLDNSKFYLNKLFHELNDKKYILYVGDRNSYKNFNILIKVINKISNYTLVIVGGKKLTNKEIKNLECTYFHYQDLPTEKLNILYNNAHCLLYPSSYEGFGIPLLEAMKAGCPVISYNKSSIPEVVEDSALLVNQPSVENFINEILKLENKEFREELIKKALLQSKKFSWDKCVDETLAFYKKIYERKFL